jgi:DNA polymerase II small subunit
MGSEILRECMKKGFLLDREMLEMFNTLDEKKTKEIIDVLAGLKLKERVVTRRVFSENLEKIQGSIFRFSKNDEVEEFFIGFGGESGEKKPNVDNTVNNKKNINDKVKIIKSPVFEKRKITVNDFVKHFKSRYEFMKGVLEEKEFDDLISIRKLSQNKGTYTIIGAVVEKKITKNKNLMLVVEDLTGVTNILVNHIKKITFEKANELLLDDIVAFSVSGSSDILFCNDVYFPEAFLSERRKHTEDIWVAFISDMHCGSKNFLENNFLRFIKWLNGEEGDGKYREIAKKVGYLFVVGDMVDGINHYPGQEKDLNILSTYQQYSKVEELIKLIRKDIQIVMCPGNHDAVWVGEPQPFVNSEWAPGLYEIDNLHLVPNPVTVEIAGGFKILMYHGASINVFVDEIPEIRIRHGHSSPVTAVKEMVKRRHLAPMHGLVDYVPSREDAMIINPVPDIIATGDQHISEVSIKNNILLVSASCWQSTFPYLEKKGIEPDPCKVPLFNLKSREIKILDFSAAPKEVEWESGDDLVCMLNSDGEKNDGSC